MDTIERAWRRDPDTGEWVQDLPFSVGQSYWVVMRPQEYGGAVLDTAEYDGAGWFLEDGECDPYQCHEVFFVDMKRVSAEDMMAFLRDILDRIMEDERTLDRVGDDARKPGGLQ